MLRKDRPYGYWPYEPNHSAAIAAAALYAVVTFITVFQYFWYRAWVWLVIIIASIMELLGFIARVKSSEQQNWDNHGLYTMQFVLIVLAPVLMAAGYYVIFGRIVFRVLPRKYATAKVIWVPPQFCTLIFVSCDMVSFALQAIGAVIVVTASPTNSDFKSKENRGKSIVLSGLALQLVCFGLFAIIAARFHFTGRKLAMPDSELDLRGRKGKKLDPRWDRLLWILNISCLCILARSIYRMVEFAQGIDGYSQTHEWVFWVFDFSPIFPCIALFNIWHPGMFLNNLGFRKSKAEREHLELNLVETNHS
ncbi:hypothetical protein M433DRAFT_110468 [Acidomyces richmondensis BFW]|nr:hypothetical protein M433DRAFT_110468 [Acidomyces richmondensis BFW]